MAATQTGSTPSRNKIAEANPIKFESFDVIINKFNTLKTDGLEKNRSEETTSTRTSKGNSSDYNKYNDNINYISNTMTRSSFQSCDVNLDDIIVCEILSRLPVKSLMRFKCVSKQWCSMIQRDRYFIYLNLEQSKARPRLFIAVPRPTKDYATFHPIGYYLVTADLLFEGGKVSPVVRTIREIDTPSKISAPLNGLVCLFDPEKNHSVQVCNLSTREVSPWIKSGFISNSNVEDNDRYLLRTAMCNLGFDHATKKHKVICTWNIHQHLVCEVLTVGDGKWRRINDLPAYNFSEREWFGASIYVNGSIYYCLENLTPVLENDNPTCIVAFDVGKEKFRTIGIPDSILDQIQQGFTPSDSVQFLEIDGNPALLSRIRCDMVKAWLFDDDDNIVNGYRSSTWNEVTILLPLYCRHIGFQKRHWYTIRFHSVTGTDFIFLYLYRCNEIRQGYHVATEVSQYSYNWKTKIFVEIKIKGLPSSIPYLSYVSGMSTSEESLLPVQ